MVLYAEEELKSGAADCSRLYQVANLFGRQLRIIRQEDEGSLSVSSISFNVHTIIGGRLREDQAPTLFYIYPEGNWIEVNTDSPYFIIGRSPYSKPMVDGLMHTSLPLHQVAALAVLAFDATQTSVTDVDYPVDMLTLNEKTGILNQHRYERHELKNTIDWWQNQQRELLSMLPMHWAEPLGATNLYS